MTAGATAKDRLRGARLAIEAGTFQAPSLGHVREGAETIDARFKGFAPSVFGHSLDDLAAERPSLFGGRFLPPIMVLREEALWHNVAAMADYARERGVQVAPHGKTSLAPKLFKLQLDAGAWGISVGTMSQVVLCRAFGIERVFLANELVDPAGIEWLLDELGADAAFEFLCYVDSVDGVRLLAERFAARGIARAPQLLLEMGPTGGRTGCRTVQEALAVGRAAAAAGLPVSGVAGYEGIIGHEIDDSVLPRVREFLALMRAAAEALAAAGLVSNPNEVVLSAGGSVFFDEVADAFTPPLAGGVKVRTVIRPGAYVTHDAGHYQRLSPFTRPGALGGHTLRPALEVWGQVISTPEPALALANVGRRDVSDDMGRPVPLRLRRPSTGESIEAAGMALFELNDQHAYLRVPSGTDAQVGDWIALGISHPCTTFDKWHLIPVVDREYHVVDLVRTYF